MGYSNPAGQFLYILTLRVFDDVYGETARSEIVSGKTVCGETARGETARG